MSDAIARAIDDAWTDLALEGEEYVRALAGEARIRHGGYSDMTVATDALVERLVIDRVLDAVDRILRALRAGEGRSDRLERVLSQTGGAATLVDAIAAAAARKSEGRKAVKDLIAWPTRAAEMLTTHRDEFVERLAGVLWEHEVRPQLGGSHPAIPLEICRPLAKLLKGKLGLRHVTDMWWRATSLGEHIADLRADSD